MPRAAVSNIFVCDEVSISTKFFVAKLANMLLGMVLDHVHVHLQIILEKSRASSALANEVAPGFYHMLFQVVKGQKVPVALHAMEVETADEFVRRELLERY